MKISIVLATYNGSKYICELLESLLAQTNQDWDLVVSDDGSNDDTLDIVKEYEAKFGKRLSIVINDTGEHGPNANFINGLRNATGTYYMFCDQDDVWLPDKVALSVQAIQNMEAMRSSSVPVLASCALTVTDGHLKPVEDIRTNTGSFSREDILSGFLTTETLLNGCSMIFNSEAKRFLLAEERLIAKSSIMYDYWLSLYVVSLGDICLIEKPMMLYRIHGSNTVGTRLDARRSLKDIPSVLNNKADFYRMSKSALSYISSNYAITDQRVEHILSLYLTVGVKHLFSKIQLVREGFLFPGGLTPKRIALLLLM